MGLAGVLLPLGAACPAGGRDPPVHAGVRRVAGAPTPGRGLRGGPPLRPAPHAGTRLALPARPRPRPDRHVSLLVHLQLDAKVPVRQPGFLDGALRAVDAGRPGGRPPRLPLVRRLRRLEGAQAGVHRVLPHLGGRAGGPSPCSGAVSPRGPGWPSRSCSWSASGPGTSRGTGRSSPKSSRPRCETRRWAPLSTWLVAYSSSRR